MNLSTVRRAVADYIASEGCSCCRGPSHSDDEAQLGNLLRVRRYPDDSGYDWTSYATPKRAPRQKPVPKNSEG